MSEWVDCFVYAAFMVVFFFLHPRAGRRLTVPMLVDRNAQWVSANPAVVRSVEKSRWFLWVLHAAGVAGIAALAAVQLGLLDLAPGPLPDGSPVPKWATLWDVNVGAMLLGLALLGGAALHFWFALYRRIPLANRRQAPLEPRSIDDFAPRWVRYAIYAVAAANLAAWAVAGVTGAYSTPLFWTRFIILAALTAIFAFYTRTAVNRRANVLDRILGTGNRRAEVRFGFFCQLLPPIVGAIRLYEEVNGIMLMDINRMMGLALVAMVTLGLLRTVNLTPRGDETGHHRVPA